MPRSKSRVRIPFPAPFPCLTSACGQAFLTAARNVEQVERQAGHPSSRVRSAPSPSGKAEVCKTSIPGSNPGGASNSVPRKLSRCGRGTARSAQGRAMRRGARTLRCRDGFARRWHFAPAMECDPPRNHSTPSESARAALGTPAAGRTLKVSADVDVVVRTLLNFKKANHRSDMSSLDSDIVLGAVGQRGCGDTSGPRI